MSEPLAVLDKDFKKWPLWKEDQVSLHLRNNQGVSGLRPSYVVREYKILRRDVGLSLPQDKEWTVEEGCLTISGGMRC